MLKVKHGKEIVLKVTNESGVPAAIRTMNPSGRPDRIGAPTKRQRVW
jgi:hypothetical protein